jgi:hypothetical protein
MGPIDQRVSPSYILPNTEENQMGRGSNNPIKSSLKIIPYGPSGPTLYFRGDVLFNYVGPMDKTIAHDEVLAVSFCWLNSVFVNEWDSDVNIGNGPTDTNKIYPKNRIASLFSTEVDEQFVYSSVLLRMAKRGELNLDGISKNYGKVKIKNTEDLDAKIQWMKEYYWRVITAQGPLTSMTPQTVSKNFQLLGVVEHKMGSELDVEDKYNHPMVPTKTNIIFGGCCKVFNFWGNDITVGSKLWFIITGYGSYSNFIGQSQSSGESTSAEIAEVVNRTPIRITPWFNPIPFNRKPPSRELCYYEVGELKRKVFIEPVFFGTVINFDVNERRMASPDIYKRACGFEGNSWEEIKKSQAFLGKVNVKRGERIYGF